MNTDHWTDDLDALRDRARAARREDTGIVGMGEPPRIQLPPLQPPPSRPLWPFLAPLAALLSLALAVAIWGRIG